MQSVTFFVFRYTSVLKSSKIRKISIDVISLLNPDTCGKHKISYEQHGSVFRFSFLRRAQGVNEVTRVFEPTKLMGSIFESIIFKFTA